MLELTDDQLGEIADLVAQRMAPAKAALTIPEAAEKLGVCDDTIRNRIRAGLIPTVPSIGRHAKRIPAAFIERALAL